MYKVFESMRKLIYFKLGVSRTIYVNVDSPNLGFSCFSILFRGGPVYYPPPITFHRCRHEFHCRSDKIPSRRLEPWTVGGQFGLSIKKTILLTFSTCAWGRGSTRRGQMRRRSRSSWAWCRCQSIVGKSDFASGNRCFRRNFPNIEEEFS